MLVNTYLKVTVLKDFTIMISYQDITDLYKASTLFLVVYRPPDVHLPPFFNLLDGLLDFVTVNKCKLVMCGDLNIYVCFTSPYELELVSVLYSSGFRNIVEALTCLNLRE